MTTKKSGFTLIEAMVIVLVVGLMAAAVTPSLVAVAKGSQARSFMARLAALGAEGREDAISMMKPVDLEYDSSSNQFKLHTTDSEGGDKYIKSVDLLPGLQPQRFQVGTKDSDPGTWKLYFYPDGTSDGGGVQMQQQTASLTLFVDKTTGVSTIVQDSLPDPATLSWSAGDYVHRAAG